MSSTINPEYYLLVPQLDALREIVSLWQTWERTGTVPMNYTPWKHLFAQLRSVRPWGPADRVSAPNREYFRNIVEGAPEMSSSGSRSNWYFARTKRPRRQLKPRLLTISSEAVGQSSIAPAEPNLVITPSWRTSLRQRFDE